MGQVVTAERASQLIQGFLWRFQQALKGLREVISPVTGRAVRVPGWDSVRSEEPALLPSAAGATVVRYGQRASPLPRSQAVLYHVAAGRGGAESFAIGALAFCHLGAFARDGVDDAPMSVAEYSVMSEAVHGVASNRGSFVAMGIASVTGFAPAVIETVAGSSSTRPLVAPTYAMCLADLSTGRLLHNPGDRRILPFLPLYRGELPEEAIERVIAHVRQALLLRASQALAEVMADTAASEAEVREAFKRLGAEPGYAVGTLKGVGLVISRRV